MNALDQVHTLTFDAFGTILDLGGSHAPRLGEFLKSRGSSMTAEELWARWRYRQRIEQYQDNQFYTGHYRGAYVNRYDLPYDETPYRFDIEARDFLDMATTLGCK